MSAKFFLSITVFIFASQLCSQTISDLKNSHISLSYSYGVAGKLEPGNRIGTQSAIELSNIPEDNIGFFANYTSTKFRFPENYFAEAYSLNNHVLTGGVRIYTNSKKVFFDAGTGYYDIEMYRTGVGEATFGFNLGIGIRAQLNRRFGIILRGKLHNAFIKKGFYREFSFNTGIEINSIKKSFASNKYSKVSTGFLAGSSVKKNNKFLGSYGAEITFSLSKHFALVGNYIYKSPSLTDQNYFAYNEYTSEKDYAGGLRNYFSEGNLRFFAECLGDLNILREKIDYPSLTSQTIVKNSLGVMLGTGAEFELTNNFSGLLKLNYTIFDNADNAHGVHGGLKYSF